MLSRF